MLAERSSQQTPNAQRFDYWDFTRHERLAERPRLSVRLSRWRCRCASLDTSASVPQPSSQSYQEYEKEQNNCIAQGSGGQSSTEKAHG